VIRIDTTAERDAMIRALHYAYMEIFPTPTIERRLAALEPGSDVAVTCSPTKDVSETLDMTERLAARGFKVVPHIAAKMVRDRAHLREIMARLDDIRVESVFVPGGDAKKPAGEFSTAFELLRAIAEFDHRFTEIGVASHPEGHPDVDDETLLRELERKQPLATYHVTQMCFDPAALGKWLRMIRARGIDLPAWIGIPGVADRAALLKISLRIGVGTSLRFLRRKGNLAGHLLRSNTYTPDVLLNGIAPFLAEAASNVAGFHIYCFNQVQRTEEWRHAALEAMRKVAG
jgi:methylenetetrahydrofolate reductase (NADPH)